MQNARHLALHRQEMIVVTAKGIEACPGQNVTVPSDASGGLIGKRGIMASLMA
jgi:hypothetical protein